MRRAPKVCSTPGCPNTQPCPAHQRTPWEGSTRRTQLPPDWERRRKAALHRDPICTLATTCNGLALSREVHHVGDKHNHDLDNLAGTCANCHRHATLQQAERGRGGTPSA